MGWARAWMLAGVFAGACESGTAAVDCENDVDVPLLRLELDETASVAGRTDDAWIFEVRTHAADVSDALAGGESLPDVVAQRVVAVEGCDAVPRTIADGLGTVHAPPRADLPWIAESEVSIGTSTPLWRIDPDGEDEPVQLTGRYSQIVWTDDGALVVDAADEYGGSLVRVRETDDGVTTTVERENALHLAIGNAELCERIALVTTDHDLVVREVASGEEQLVRPAVETVWSSDARSRFLMVTSAVEKRHIVVNVDEGTSIDVLEGSDDTFVGTWMTKGSAQAQRFGDMGAVESQIVLFPELRELRLPGDWWCSDCTRQDSDSVLLRGPDGLYRLDDGADVPVRLRGVRAEGFITGDRIHAFEEVPPSAAADPFRTTYRVVRLDLDGSNAVDLLLGETASDVIRLSSDRWLYSHDVGNDLVGELVVMDTATTAREEVADDVLFQVYSRLGVEPEDTDEIAYLAVSDNPDRHGMWLTHVDRLLE